jgi:hypothetical protein
VSEEQKNVAPWLKTEEQETAEAKSARAQQDEEAQGATT